MKEDNLVGVLKTMHNHNIMVYLSQNPRLHNIIYTYPLHSTETNLYFLGKRSEASTLFTQSHNFYSLINGYSFLVLSNLFHNTNRCVNLSQIVLRFKSLCACLASNIN